MSYRYLPLSDAEKGREYIIRHIRDDKKNIDRYSGYGIYPGTRIRPLFSSPSGNPSAYEVMGAVLVLRDEDSCKIYVSSW